MPRGAELEWDAFLRRLVTLMRKYAQSELTPEEKAVVDNSAWMNIYGFAEPSQVVVFEPANSNSIAFLVVHDLAIADCTFASYAQLTSLDDLKQRITNKEPQPFWLRPVKQFEALGIDFFTDIAKDIFETTKTGGEASYFGPSTAVHIFSRKAARKSPEYVSRALFSSLRDEIRSSLIEKQKKQIEESASTLKEEAQAIPSKDIQERILSSTSKIEKALQRIDELDEHERKLRTIDAEIAGVRSTNWEHQGVSGLQSFNLRC